MLFFKEIYKSLMENEFKLINGFYDNINITDESVYIGMCKYVGNMLYVVTIINKENTQDYKALLSDFYLKAKRIVQNVNASKALLLNLVLYENKDDDFYEYIKNIEFDFESELVNVCWGVDLCNNKIIVGENQPDQILNIHNILNNCFKMEEQYKEDSVYTIMNEVMENKRKQTEGNGCFITYALLIINFLIFALMELSGGSESYSNLVAWGALLPEKLLNDNEYYRLFTDMFLHIGYVHIIANSLSLYILGTRLEPYLKKAVFISIYLISGVGASLASLLFTRGLSAGASGAIFGILGSMLVYSKLKGKSLGDFSLYFIILYSISGVMSGFLMEGVDNAGHIGGFLTGAVITFLYLKLSSKEDFRQG